MPLSPAKLTQARERAGLLPSQAARLAGMSAQQWANLEHGRCLDPQVSTVQRIAAALKCSLKSLLS